MADVIKRDGRKVKFDESRIVSALNKAFIDVDKVLTEEAKEVMDDMMYAPQDPEGRSFQNVYKLIIEDDITDLLDDKHFSTFFSVFKPLEQKEIKRYKENC
jgi:transcriptional regulator NrdR family protein